MTANPPPLRALSTSWSFPTALRIGAGCVTEVASACSIHGITNPLIVTDPGIAELPVIDAIGAAFGDELAMFSAIKPNPIGANIDEGAHVFRAGNHDGVIAVGGGSALDSGKVIAFVARQSRPLWDFEDVGNNYTRADTNAIAPVVAIPTTAGTGSEVGRAGVVVNEAEQRKVIIFHPEMLPVAVLCDPELTVGLPVALTVGTGMDALSHSLEAICAPNFHPMAHGIGLEGCRLVLDHLPRVVADPGDIASRTQMMAAAAMGAVAFQKGLGAMHALSHPIGAMFDTHHGMTNAVVMPYVLQANKGSIDDTIAALAAYTAIGGGFDGFLDHIQQLRADIGVPNSLVDLGVDPTLVEDIASAAVLDPSAAGNPQPLTHDLAAAIFTAACEGRL